MLTPEKMEKIRLIIKKEHLDALLNGLYSAGIVQIEPLNSELKKIAMQIELKEHTVITEYARKFDRLMGELYPEKAHETVYFDSISNLIEEAEKVNIFEKASMLKSKIETLDAKMSEIEENIKTVEKLKWFGRDMKILNNRHVASFIVYTGFDDIASSLNGNGIDFIYEKNGSVAVISIERENEKPFGKVIAGMPKASVMPIPACIGKPEDAIRAMKAELQNAKNEKDKLESELRKLSEQNYGKVSAIAEQLNIELKKMEAIELLGGLESVAILEGWVPNAEMPKLKKIADNAAGDEYAIETITNKEEVPPTKLTNKRSKLFEFFIRFYSLPKGNEIDPTSLFAILFPIFFGFMIGDAGYGIVMIAMSFAILYTLKKSGSIKGKLFSKIASFVSSVLSKNSIRVIAKSIIPGAVVAIALGIIFNQWFGFQLPYNALFNPELHISKLILISGLIGMLAVVSGFAIGVANKLMLNEKREALGRLGWMLMALGIVAFGLEIIYKVPISFSLQYIATFISIIAGLAFIAYGEGASSLIEMPSMISHILSYTRLAGILLASLILAQVINYMFLHSLHHSIMLAIAGIFVLFIGQAFNILIALFEPGIQGARLIYVEFFSKFFSGNGKEFTPFKGTRVRTAEKRHMKTT